MDWIIIVYVLGACAVAGFLAVDWYRHGSGCSVGGAIGIVWLVSILWPITVGWAVASLAADFWQEWRADRAARPRRRPVNSYRWSDNDRYWWRFTYANENRPDGRGREERRIFGLYLTSKGDEDDGSFCLLRGQLLGRTLILRLPALFQPAREWHDITTEPTRTQMLRQGRKPGYWETWERSYGFLFVSGSLHVDFGQQTHDSTTDRSKVWFLPWRRSQSTSRRHRDRTP